MDAGKHQHEGGPDGADAPRLRARRAARNTTRAKPRKKRKKPRLVIVTEHYALGHAIHRTHSRAVRSLRKRFEVLGVLHGAPSEPDVLSCFDDIIHFPMDDLDGR